jgi:hypothetical protein
MLVLNRFLKLLHFLNATLSFLYENGFCKMLILRTVIYAQETPLKL